MPDTAKAVAIGIPYTGDVWDFFEKGVVPEKVLSIGVISTTASSGSGHRMQLYSNLPYKYVVEVIYLIDK